METLKKYLTYQLKDGSYAGSPGVVAMANLLDIWFEIFDFQDGGLKKHLCKGSENVDGNLISLAYNGSSQYYSLAVTSISHFTPLGNQDNVNKLVEYASDMSFVEKFLQIDLSTPSSY